MGFYTGLNIGEVITNNDIVNIFKCANMGGMRKSRATNTLVLICDHSKSVYVDSWNDGILLYTGTGKEGNQVLKGTQNATLYESGLNGIEVHLFEVFSGGQYTYSGVVELAKEPYQAEQEDIGGNKRLVWVFPLRKCVNNVDTNGKIKLSIKDLPPELAQGKIKNVKPGGEEATCYDGHKRCAYNNQLVTFLNEEQHEWLQKMKTNFGEITSLELGESQIRAWRDCFKVLKNELKALAEKRPDYHIVFEYFLPYESGRRPDVLLISKEEVIVLEFKQYGTIKHADVDQVAAYARDLQEYHFETRDKAVKAVLVLTGVKEQVFDTDGVKICAGNKLSYVLDKIIAARTSSENIEKWLYSKYAPLPTIVEAARMFMRKEELPAIKSVEQECFNDALDCLEKVTEEAKREGKHVLAFVTGVPGSGKTFLGLQFVYDICDKEATKCDSVYLSGNGPLVKVLQDALKNKAFVKDLHNIIKQYLKTGAIDFNDNVIVFDEGQRAWDRKQMNDKHQVNKTEPEAMIEMCGKRLDWCVLLVLVGEGQEINSGENSGLKQWDEAINEAAVDWEIVCPEKLNPVFRNSFVKTNNNALNLTKSLRSHLAKDVSTFVNYIIDGDISKARELCGEIYNCNFSMYVTRNLEKAKEYVRDRYATEPSKKYGLLASAKGSKLKFYGMDNSYMRTKNTDIAKWFNAPKDDFRSCCALEEVVTEFGCQGLEIDMPIVGWNNDMQWLGTCWKKFILKEDRDSDKNTYRVNAYRVLLTRGRDGFVIFVPTEPELDSVYEMLLSVGVRPLDKAKKVVYGEVNDNGLLAAETFEKYDAHK